MKEEDVSLILQIALTILQIIQLRLMENQSNELFYNSKKIQKIDEKLERLPICATPEEK